MMQRLADPGDEMILLMVGSEKPIKLICKANLLRSGERSMII